MPKDPGVLGFAGQWYPGAASGAVEKTLHTGRTLLVPSPAFALACKVDAWLDRGRNDPLGSKDLEDIVALLDGCREFPEVIDQAPPELRTWLKEQLPLLVVDDRMVEAVTAHLPRGGDLARREQRLLGILSGRA